MGNERRFERLPGAGEASLFRGDPRLPESDLVAWFNGMLGSVKPPTMRPYLYGADAGLCARRNVLLEHNTWLSDAVTPSSNAYMSLGVALEDMLAKALYKTERLLVQSHRIQEIPGLKISGKIDLVAFDHQDELALFEIKSCGKLPNEPNPVHLAQIQTYVAVSGVRKAWLVYVSRNVRQEGEFNNQVAMRSFAVPCDDNALRERLRIAALSRLASDLHLLPPVPGHFRKHTECHYCVFRDSYCYGSRPGLGGEEPTVPKHPLTEIDLQVHIDLDTQAQMLASLLVDNIESRYQKTIGELLEEALPYHLRAKLNSLLLST